MTRTRLSIPGGALLAAVLLSGCISLFPKAKPAQLYRFEAASGAPSAIAAQSATGALASGAPRVNLVLPPPTFPRAEASDQILTVTGEETAYLAGARWVAPAQVLFEESTRRAFAGRATGARLVGRGEIGASDAFLRLDVSAFEVRYADPAAAPTVRVVLRGLLTHKNGAFAADRTFAAEVPATENRVGAIVAAFSTATEKVTSELLNWTDANAALAATAPPPIDGVTTSSTTTSSTTVRRPPPR